MDKPLRLIELFAGYGSQALALKRLNIPFEHYRVVEFDKYAVKSYNAVHNTNFKVTDIRDVSGEDLGIVDTDKYNYCLTYSFPCTDLSIAGNMQGMSRDSGTRSGLLWEVERLLRELNAAQKLRLPQFLLMENVPQVHSDKNIKDFAEWIRFLDSLGYISKWQDLNAKDYGVAQNRERCFMVSYLDKSLMFAFPESIPLTKTARDYLEDDVPEKYYIKTKKAKELITKLIMENDKADIISIKANTDKGFSELESGGIVDLSYPESSSRRGRVQTRGRVCPTITSAGELNIVDKSRRVVDKATTESRVKDISGSILTSQRGISDFHGKETGILEKIVVEERTDEGLRTFDSALSGALRTTDSCGDKRVVESCIKVGDLGGSYELASRVYATQGVSPAITTNEGYIPKFIEDKARDELIQVGALSGFESRNRVYSVEGIVSTLQTSKEYNCPIIVDYRIRKLTPLECYRLMDVDDEDAKKMLAINSETQCYKQAGNSIVVSVLAAIFKNMFLGGSNEVRAQLDIFDIL